MPRTIIKYVVVSEFIPSIKLEPFITTKIEKVIKNKLK